MVISVLGLNESGGSLNNSTFQNFGSKGINVGNRDFSPLLEKYAYQISPRTTGWFL